MRTSVFLILTPWLLLLGSGIAIHNTKNQKAVEVRTTNVAILVHLKEQRAYLYRSGELLVTTQISSGKKYFETPTGRFRIKRKIEDHVSSVYSTSGKTRHSPQDEGAPMKYYIEFTPGYGIHAGDVSNPYSSHGCIRMNEEQAKLFFTMAKVGGFIRIIR